MNTFLVTPLRWALTAVLSMSLATSGCSVDSEQSLVSSGQALLAKKNYKGAIIQFKTALQKNPQSREARYLLGLAFLESSDPAAAAAELSKALDEKADANKVVPALVRSYLLIGEYQKITSIYGGLQLEDKGAQASLKSTVANAWAAQGDRAKTEIALAAALAAQSDYPPALVLEARIQAGKGDLVRAINLVDGALKLDDRLYDAWHLKGEILALGKGGHEAAVKAYRQALSIEPAYLESHIALIRDRVKARDLPGAQAQAEQLRKMLPKHPQTFYITAQLAFASREFKQARELTQVLLRGLPTEPSVLHLAGIVEAQLGALVVAESHLVKALQLNPNLLTTRRILGQTYLRMGQPQKALNTLQPALTAGTKDAEVLALAGETYLRLGDIGAAESAFKQAVALKPDDLKARTALALTFLARGDATTAFADLAAISEANKQDTYADQAIISARLRRREFEQALKAADALVAKGTAKGFALETRGRIQLALKNYVAARQDFELALRADPALFSATVHLAGLDILEKQPEQARQRLEKSVKEEPKNYYARLALADLISKENANFEETKAILSEGIRVSPGEPTLRLKLVDLLLMRKQFKEALAIAEDGSVLMPSEPAILDALGRSQMEVGNIEQSLTTFRRLADLDPRSPVAFLRLADIYIATKRLPAAEAALRKALEIAPNTLFAQNSLADLLLNADRFAEVIQLARSMQTQRPRAVHGYVLEAKAHFRQKQPALALGAFRRGMEAKDHDPDLARLYLIALHQSGNSDDANRFAAKWLKVHPGDVAFEYQLAVISIQTKKYEEADERLRRVVQAKPDHSAALNNLAWVLANGGKAGASAYAQRAVNLAPNKPEFMDTLALALMVDKQPAKALELQKRVVELRPTEPAYRLSLARMAIEAGDKALARTELERLKALGASYPQQAEVAALAQKL